MSTQTVPKPAPGGARATSRRRRRGALRSALGRAVKTARGRIGLLLALSVGGIAFLGPILSKTDPNAFAGAPFSADPGLGPLGTDVLGRSVSARVLEGGWQILLMALIATVIAVAVGAFLGVFAAYVEGWVDQAIMRSIDVLLVIPQLVLALLLVSVSSTSRVLVVAAVAVSQAPQIARVIHGSAQGVCERDFVKAVAMWGVHRRRVIFGQVVPNLVTPLSVEVGLRLSFSIVLISGLNFLGFGVVPPDPNWGTMVNENRIGLEVSPWGVVVPAILLGVLAVGINMFSDAIARANLGNSGAEMLEITTALAGEKA